MPNTGRSELSTYRRGSCCNAPTDSPGHLTHATCNLVLANGYASVLAVYDSGPQNVAIVPPGVVDFGGTRTTAAQIRRHILERLGDNNYLVGFHLA